MKVIFHISRNDKDLFIHFRIDQDLNFINHPYLYIKNIKIEVRNLIAENKLIHSAVNITILIIFFFNPFF